MLRRLIKSDTALGQKQQELVRQESELRDQVEKLERMIADAPRVAEEKGKRAREELLMRANQGGNRLDVSMALHDKRYGDAVSGPPRRGTMRKERREGRIIFIVLMIALFAAVIWLIAHFRSF
jgi:septal ring factor EnvC (AmiA/AmiB activator)